MNLYIDESGSINNHIPNNKYFVIAIVRAINKDALKRSYKRFVSANYDRLFELDQDKIDCDGKCFQAIRLKNLKAHSLIAIWKSNSLIFLRAKILLNYSIFELSIQD